MKEETEKEKGVRNPVVDATGLTPIKIQAPVERNQIMNIYRFEHYERDGKRLVKILKHANDNRNKSAVTSTHIFTTCGEKREIANDGSDRLIDSVFSPCCGDM